ncbi:MAG: response regulator, partial [Butyrivibrio sp.]|nr:response regulator [Butyrivibrio sp.]
MAGILIVDDAPVNRNLLRNMLEIEGYEVVGEAENGKEGY